MKQIKIFQDGPNFKEIKDFYEKVDGYTFNPSLFKKLGARNYLEFTSEILKYTGNKSVSIEIFADNEKDCFEQALKINSINKNIVVKIPGGILCRYIHQHVKYYWKRFRGTPPVCPYFI